MNISCFWMLYLLSKGAPYLDFKFSFCHFPGSLWHRWCEVILCTPPKSITSPFHRPIHAVHTKETNWWFIWCGTNQDEPKATQSKSKPCSELQNLRYPLIVVKAITIFLSCFPPSSSKNSEGGVLQEPWKGEGVE